MPPQKTVKNVHGNTEDRLSPKTPLQKIVQELTQCSPVLLSVMPGLSSCAFTYASAPPSTTELLASTDYYGIPSKIYRSPHYSKVIDAPEKPREYAGLLYYLRGGNGLAVLEDWDHGSGNHKVNVADVSVECVHTDGWEFASSPPSVREVKKWHNSNPKGVIKPISKLNSQVNRVLLNFRV
jgi:DNA polymerase zeta